MSESPTDVVIPSPSPFLCEGGDVVLHFVVVVEEKRLKGVEDEVPHVLVHVRVQDASVETINGATTVHHLVREKLAAIQVKPTVRVKSYPF